MHIRSGWLAYVALRILLSYVLLAFTMISTRKLRAPVPKNSALATLLAATDAVRVSIGNIDSFDDAGKRSREIKVWLVGDKLVLVQGTEQREQEQAQGTEARCRKGKGA
ncbi:hypothetical protein GQ53DRAFT_768365 [Thozetella sp. PMI_491]|nr:hypothetical protein GQ53DRAFT_768365 [Thozetella sp. PMI_491]